MIREENYFPVEKLGSQSSGGIGLRAMLQKLLFIPSVGNERLGFIGLSDEDH